MALNDETPGFMERILAMGSIGVGHLCYTDKESLPFAIQLAKLACDIPQWV
jgi:hypothetical protein